MKVVLIETFEKNKCEEAVRDAFKRKHGISIEEMASGSLPIIANPNWGGMVKPMSLQSLVDEIREGISKSSFVKEERLLYHNSVLDSSGKVMLIVSDGDGRNIRAIPTENCRIFNEE